MRSTILLALLQLAVAAVPPLQPVASTTSPTHEESRSVCTEAIRGERFWGRKFSFGQRLTFLQLPQELSRSVGFEWPALPRILQNSVHPIRVGFGRARKCDTLTILSCISRSSKIPQKRRHQHFLASNNIIGRVARGGGSQVKAKRKSSRSSDRTTSSSSTTSRKKKKSNHESPLSDSTPFFSVEAISDMTLSDVGRVFDYAIKSTRSDFEQAEFLEQVGPRVRKALQAMDKASAKSRGPNVRIPTTTSTSDEQSVAGDVDTFHFCAAMRILTEWRMVRQVPEGYKSFAVSMKMGHKDVVKNIGKMEEAAHAFIDSQKDKQGASAVIYSPTLRDLLQFELDTETHAALPKLKEVSGAMGLLWVKRQLQFQLAFFENALDKNNLPSAEAFQSAYAGVYSNYHGVAVKKIFNYSLQGAPEKTEVYKCMNPRRLQEVHSTPRHIIAASMRQPADSDDNMSSGKDRLSGLRRSGSAPAQTLQQPVDPEPIGDEEVEQWVANEMEKDALGHMEAFLHVSQPLLGDLALVIDEFNMNDPKKV